MSVPKQQSLIRYLQYLPYLPALIQAAERIHGASTGPQKKAAALGAFAWLVGAAEPLVLANNPALAPIAPIVDGIVAELTQTGQMAPAPVPATQPLLAVAPVAAAAP